MKVMCVGWKGRTMLFNYAYLQDKYPFNKRNGFSLLKILLGGRDRMEKDDLRGAISAVLRIQFVYKWVQKCTSEYKCTSECKGVQVRKIMSYRRVESDNDYSAWILCIWPREFSNQIKLKQSCRQLFCWKLLKIQVKMKRIKFRPCKWIWTDEAQWMWQINKINRKNILPWLQPALFSSPCAFQYYIFSQLWSIAASQQIFKSNSFQFLCQRSHHTLPSIFIYHFKVYVSFILSLYLL